MLIEADKANFKKLQSTYFKIKHRCKFENQIVGNGKPSVFYSINVKNARLDPSIPSFVKLEQMHSLNKEVLENCLDGILTPHLEETQVETVLLETLLSQHKINKVGLLHIDAEGSDLEILKPLIQRNLLPTLILFEKRHLSNKDLMECTNLLAANCRLRYFEHDMLCILR